MDPYLITVITAVGTGLTGAVGYLWREMLRLQKADGACRERLSQVTAEVWGLRARLEQLVWTGDDEPNGLVVIDGDTGLVMEWSPGTTVMLHWTAREMLGKSMMKLIPERFRQLHIEAMEKLRREGRLPRRGPFGFQVLTKEGAEIPCEIKLSGWSVGNQRFISAQIKPRLPDHEMEPTPRNASEATAS